MRSLRVRLGAVWILSLAASLAVGLLMSQLYARSTSASTARASDAAARACTGVREAWRYYATGWDGTLADGDASLRTDLRGVLAAALDGSGVLGGIWQSGVGLLASTSGAADAVLSQSLWESVAVDAASGDGDLVRAEDDGGDTVVIAACALTGPVTGLVAWTARRVPDASGLAELRAGFAVLLALVLTIALCLTWLVVTWSRHVGRIETALAGNPAGGLPLLPATGERELDRIVGALNLARARLADSQRDAAALAARIAGAERMAALGRVAAGVAHEIRNPIAAMRLRAENALAGDDARRRVALDAILGQVARLDRLTGELLAMTQGRAPEPASVDLAEFLETVRGEYEDAARAADVAMGVACERSAVACIDAAMIGRAVANLVANAIRATASGGSVQLAGMVAADMICITVRDTGTGVPAGLREKMFEPFVTGHADGTGLGLAIARELVVSHGGTLTLDPADGPGACFTIALPQGGGA